MGDFALENAVLAEQTKVNTARITKIEEGSSRSATQAIITRGTIVVAVISALALVAAALIASGVF